jgi:formylglycine-generating enzyme required for sulfatase activity
VTIAAYQACSSCGSTQNGDPDCNASSKTSHPVNCVTWEQADCCCKKLGKRLPTEQEWEWAARHGADAWLYAWGNSPPAQEACWDKNDGTCPVGQYPSYGFGLRDMTGNVFEWTSSPFDAATMVARGGAWANQDPDYLAIGLRPAVDPTEQDRGVGLRCALSP